MYEYMPTTVTKVLQVEGKINKLMNRKKIINE